eukprot:gene8495-10091_t
MPALWPVGHVFEAATKKSKEEAPTPVASPILDLVGNFTSFAGALRGFLLALVCIYVLPTDTYPAFGPAATWQWSWMQPIVVRNLCAAWTICGFWDWFLYFSPLKAKLHKYKLNPLYPEWSQFQHDAFWTTSASLTAAAIEVAMCHLWATGRVEYQEDMWATPVWNAAWILGITHWRVPHFWLIHRAMHPWKTKSVPDLGKILYKHVHSLHHRSYNPTAFSGTSMHPVESTLYYSAAFICVPFGCHPAIFLACIIDCAVGAWLGHDGFQWPGSGDYFHQLHHAHFDCNYGAVHVPLDKWFGTFAGSKGAVAKIWGRSSK